MEQMLQSVSEHFSMISWHCTHYVILLLIALSTLVHDITQQATEIQKVAKNKETGLSL